MFSMHREMQQHDLPSKYLGLNVCFYTMFLVGILGLNIWFDAFLTIINVRY